MSYRIGAQEWTISWMLWPNVIPVCWVTIDEVNPSIDEMATLVAAFRLFLDEGKKVALIHSRVKSPRPE